MGLNQTWNSRIGKCNAAQIAKKLPRVNGYRGVRGITENSRSYWARSDKPQENYLFGYSVHCKLLRVCT